METFVGDIVRINLETSITLTGYTVRIRYKKPNGQRGSWDATIAPADDSIMYYDTDQTDLDVHGTWRLQAFAYSGAVVRGHGKICELEVFEVIETEEPTTAPPTTAVPTTAP